MAGHSAYQGYKNKYSNDLTEYIETYCPVHVKRERNRQIFIGVLGMSLVLFFLFLMLYLLVDDLGVFLAFMIIFIVVAALDVVWFLLFLNRTKQDYNDETQYIIIYENAKQQRAKAELNKKKEAESKTTSSSLKESK